MQSKKKKIQTGITALYCRLSRDVGGASFDVIIKICKQLNVDPMEFYSE